MQVGAKTLRGGEDGVDVRRLSRKSAAFLRGRGDARMSNRRWSRRRWRAGVEARISILETHIERMLAGPRSIDEYDGFCGKCSFRIASQRASHGSAQSRNKPCLHCSERSQLEFEWFREASNMERQHA